MHSDLTPGFFPCLYCRRLPPLGASRCSRTPGLCWEPRRGADSRGLGKVGRAGPGLTGPHPKRSALLGSLLGTFRAPSWSPLQGVYQLMSKVPGKVMGSRNGSAFPFATARPSVKALRVLWPLSTAPPPPGERAPGETGPSESRPRGMGGCGCFHLPPRHLKSPRGRDVGT